MSGGHFEYDQYKIGYIADSIERILRNQGKETEYGQNETYPEEVQQKMIEAINILRKAEIYAHRIDWLVCADDGNETFIERLAEDLGNLREFKK